MKVIHFFYSFSFIVLVSFAILAQKEKILEAPISSKSTFVVLSHIYFANPQDLKALEERFKELRSKYILIVGDAGEVGATWIQTWQKLGFTILMVPGDADGEDDLAKIDFFQNNPQIRFWKQRIFNSLLVGLDSSDCAKENSPEGCYYSEDQLTFLANSLETATLDTSLDNIIILSHHSFWLHGMLQDSHVKNRVEKTCRRGKDQNFYCPWINISLKNLWYPKIHQLLKKTANEGKNIYVIGGDSAMNGQFELEGVFYYMTGYRPTTPDFDWFEEDRLEFLNISAENCQLNIQSEFILRPNTKEN